MAAHSTEQRFPCQSRLSAEDDDTVIADFLEAEAAIGGLRGMIALLSEEHGARDAFPARPHQRASDDAAGIAPAAQSRRRPDAAELDHIRQGPVEGGIGDGCPCRLQYEMRLLRLQTADKLRAITPQRVIVGEAERLAIERDRPRREERELRLGGWTDGE